MQQELKCFDRVADCYDATRAFPPGIEPAVVDGIVRALREVAPAPTVLEVGIGTGRIAVPLTAAGARVIGVDIAPAMLARLRAKHPTLPVLIAEATRLPFAPARFDGALFVHLLHLLSDPGAALRAATQVVRPGGVLLYGRTDHSTSPLRAVVARARELAREIGGVSLGASDWHREANRSFAEHARAIGARTSDTLLARWREQSTAREVLDALAGRVYSSTWVISDAVMPELLRRLTPWAEAQLGSLDRPVENEISFSLMVAHLPS